MDEMAATASTSAASKELEIGDSDFEESEENSVDEDVFFRSILDNDIESLRLHLEGSYSPKSINSAGCMALHYAVINSKVDILKILAETMKKDDINVVSPDDGMTPLHTSMNGHVATEITEMLCNFGADVNGENATGIPVLQYLISLAWSDFEDNFASEQEGIEARGNSVQLPYSGESFVKKLRILHRHGVDMNIKGTTTKWLPLHLWCRHFSHRTKHLLETGLKTEWCHTFLTTLLDCGADVNMQNCRDQSAMWCFAERCYKSKHVHFVDQYAEMIGLLLDKVTFPGSRDIFNRSLAHVSCEFSNLVLLDQLVRRNWQVNVSDCFGLTPLHLVCHNITDEESDLVIRELDLLIEYGANLNCQDDFGSTPLHHCVSLENHLVMKYLLNAGADVNVSDADGRSVVDLAIIHKHPKILKLLGLKIERANNGASDGTIGRIFPMCCHQLYSDDLKWNEIETPCVSLEHYKEWLSEYPICRHNRDVVLQNSMKELETNSRLERMTARDAAQAYTEVLRVLETAASAMKELNPVFEPRVIVGGSNAEYCKVGQMDEMDFVFSLPVFSKMVDVYDEDLPESLIDFVRLRPNSMALFETLNLGHLLDSDGFVKRSAVGRTFHQLLNRVLTRQALWKGSRIFTDEGTIGGNLACSNIGQLKIVWYGPNYKRLTISIDIVPALILGDWKVRCLRQDINILLSPKVVQEQHGFFLVMKKFGEGDDGTDLDEETVRTDEGLPVDELFTVSASQIEHACLRFSPPEVRNGYKIAKSIQLLCPRLMKHITGDEIDFLQDSLPGNLVEVVDQKLMFCPNVYNLITSYSLKTALLHCLHDSNVKFDFTAADLNNKTWNQKSIQNLSKEVTREGDIPLSVEWAKSIYAKLLDFFRNDILWYHSYFILDNGTDERRLMLDMAMAYCEVILHYLDSFDSRGRQLIYSKYDH